MVTSTIASRGQRSWDRHDIEKSSPESHVKVKNDDLACIRLQRDELPTPTTTVKNEPTCPYWDLHSAASSECGGEAIRRFIISGGDPRAEQWGNSPLHVAAYGGRVEAVRVALSHGADVEQRNRARETALHLACRGAHSDVVRLLLEGAADPMSEDICGRTPADVVSGDYERSHDIHELLRKSDELRELGALKRRVHIQVCHNSTQAVEKLLSVGGSVDIRDAAQRTLLHRACEEASVDMVAKLLALGATVDATEKRRQTPLHRACERGRLDVVRLLFEQGGANCRAVAKQQHEPLHVACLGNWGALVTYLLEKGRANVEIADKNGKRPLHLAVEANKLESIRALLKYGCNVEATLSDGVTRSLHIACQRGFERSATLLLDYSASHAAPGAGRLFPLHMAAKEGRIAIVELLIGRNADIRAKDSRGHTPLQSTNNRRCRDRLREAERKEEAAAAKKRVQAEQHRRALASKRREEEVLRRVSLRSRAWAPN